MTKPCILFVHAHPDDEASSTGATIAKAHAEGLRTVLVTCTNGELGDSPTGLPPDHDDHDGQEVARHRREELEASCRILGIDRLELLGYHDSGMMGWESNERSDCFWQVPIEEAAAKLAAIIEEEGPDVVVTYDEKGFYGHPDHIQANRITQAALGLIASKPALYYPVLPLSRAMAFADLRESTALESEGPSREEMAAMATPDEEVVAIVDGTAFVERKRAALFAHHSQTGSSFFADMPEELFAQVFGFEAYARPGFITDDVANALWN